MHFLTEKPNNYVIVNEETNLCFMYKTYGVRNHVNVDPKKQT